MWKVVSLTLLTTACGGAEFSLLPDDAGGSDACVAPDGARCVVFDDSGVDSGLDVRGSHEPDAGVDADARVDAGVDAAPIDASPPPDTGCTPLTHHDGLGQDYSSCAPLGTYDQAAALAACAAFTGDAGLCEVTGCPPAGVVCSSGSTVACACWAYTSATAGRVSNTGMPGSANCRCPGISDPTWN